MPKPIDPNNFQPMTDDEIEELWKKRTDTITLEQFKQEVRDEEEAVKVLLGLGFTVVEKSQIEN